MKTQSKKLNKLTGKPWLDFSMKDEYMPTRRLSADKMIRHMIKISNPARNMQLSDCGRYLLEIIGGSFLVYDTREQKIAKKYTFSNPLWILTFETSSKVVVSDTMYKLLVIDLEDFNYQKIISLKERYMLPSIAALCRSDRDGVLYCAADVYYEKKGVKRGLCKLYEVDIETESFKVLHSTDEYTCGKLEYSKKNNVFYMVQRDNKHSDYPTIPELVFSTVSVEEKRWIYYSYKTELFFKTVWEGDIRSNIVEIYDEMFSLVKNISLPIRKSYNVSTSGKRLFVRSKEEIFVISIEDEAIVFNISFGKLKVNEIYASIFDDIRNVCYLSCDKGVCEFRLNYDDKTGEYSLKEDIKTVR
jgi:hypothetical protein